MENKRQMEKLKSKNWNHSSKWLILVSNHISVAVGQHCDNTVQILEVRSEDSGH